ncbi:acyl-CoA ligase (AMP-forming), exosortase A system-associated [Ramlibacter sp.]|uniref:acyl-CoA ligase (AMP-forming), exosortase A system-associated n=1 Tax=Ramlibacter sp. TaxID=1917967 RepID=UPI0018555DBF|nr:acyl-CoA ligase (AMP-forming), exosortase A system-associated [Ramlibacter sp.]MBA2674447.1 acyl-CoA ligase (AMP-forming), exosortase A system-associated [Ramlibacter sp.]
MVTLFDSLQATAALRSAHPALIHQNDSIAYGALLAQARAAAGAMRECGVCTGDRVAIYADKRFEMVLAMLGASALGAVFVPVNPQLKPHQVMHILRDAEAKLLVTTGGRHDALCALEGTVPATLLLSDAGDRKERAAARWNERLAAAAPLECGASVVDSDLAAILYTSGSTGMPKGVMVTHRNLGSGAASVNQYLGNRPEEVILSLLPLSFDAGLSQLTTAIGIGATLVLLNFLTAAEVVRVCQKHGVTAMTAVPPLWHQLTAAAWPAEVAGRLRYFANTGGHMPATLLATLRALFVNANPYLMYGLTEAFRSTYLDPAEVDRRPNSIGKAVPNAQILVLRPDGSECDPGEHGELVHRGAFVTRGYWKDRERTEEKFRRLPAALMGPLGEEIAVWSGDIVHRDDEGFLYFVGRKDDLIKVSGYRISPTEIEEVVLATGLAREAAVIGVPHPTLGAEIVAFVVPADDQLHDVQVIQACKPRLPTYMVPARVVLLDALPRNGNGKFDRKQLAADLQARDSQTALVAEPA